MKRKEKGYDPLSRRQRQVMEILHAELSASARRVWELIDDQPSYASVRTVLRSLVERGHAKYVRDGKTFIYSPSQKREAAAESAMSRLVNTFYKGSVAGAVSGLLGLGAERMNREELDAIAEMIDNAKEENDNE